MTKPKTTNSSRPTAAPAKTSNADVPMAAKDHYQREKARRARHDQPDTEAMASAKREYKAMLETNAAKGRGGRPKKRPASPPDVVAEEDEADVE